MFVRLWGFGTDYTLGNAAAVYFVLLYRVWRHPDPSQTRFARELGSEEVYLGAREANGGDSCPFLVAHSLHSLRAAVLVVRDRRNTLRRLILKRGLLFVNPNKSARRHQSC